MKWTTKYLCMAAFFLVVAVLVAALDSQAKAILPASMMVACLLGRATEKRIAYLFPSSTSPKPTTEATPSGTPGTDRRE